MNRFIKPLFWLGQQAALLAQHFQQRALATLKSAASRMPWVAPTYRSVSVDEMPDALRPKRIYIAGEGENLWAAGMICPCGCGETIELNLLPQVRPRWEVSRRSNGSVSLHPSVWRKSGCRSHFWVRDGKIIWC